MINNMQQALKVQAKRVRLGKKGIAVAVNKFIKDLCIEVSSTGQYFNKDRYNRLVGELTVLA